jgi:hypothetical protein
LANRTQAWLEMAYWGATKQYFLVLRQKAQQWQTFSSARKMPEPLKED